MDAKLPTKTAKFTSLENLYVYGTSFIDHAIQIYVGQKDKANQWKVIMVLEEFLHALLLYQEITARILNVLAVL